MEKLKNIEVFGSLDKVEELSTISHNIIPGTLVFDSLSPFWGYYNDEPQDSSPIYVYVALDKTYTVFEIVRAFEKVKAELAFNLDVAKAFIQIKDKMFNVLRVRHLVGYSKIGEIQKAFAKNGIKPLVNSVRYEKVTAQISLNKMFYMANLSDEIFLDTIEENHAYFEISRELTFSEFSEISKKVQNNWFDRKFDIAIGSYLTGHRVVDFIRIYSENQSVEYLEKIRKLFLQKMG
jgi:hypothetical protein